MARSASHWLSSASDNLLWWTAWDSNPRPPRCERGALPAELAAHYQGKEATIDFQVAVRLRRDALNIAVHAC